MYVESKQAARHYTNHVYTTAGRQNNIFSCFYAEEMIVQEFCSHMHLCAGLHRFAHKLKHYRIAGKFGEHFWRIGEKMHLASFNFGNTVHDPLTQKTKCYIGEL